ncbi:AAA family ATPase [Citrobacter freundii]
MTKFLTKIYNNTDSSLDDNVINIQGKNLIITGGNGCGKTTLLNEINNKISTHLINKNVQSMTQLNSNLQHYLREREKHPKGSNQYHQAQTQIQYYEKEIERTWGGLQIEYSDQNELSILLHSGKAIIANFQANRQATIDPATGANKLAKTDESNFINISNQQLGNKFEQHLANLKTRQSFAKTYDNNITLYNSIDNWFNQLENNIAYLMEDETFTLKFEPDDFKFYLIQENKKPYTFQTLSSGYSAIFNILSDLIMKTETFKISPSELHGIVMIDEIDAHLHVSLQRKILPFLTRTYPLIQFIVTTHSPFVIGSLEDAIIYDLSSKQHFEDLSIFSYETIIEGLLGVPVVSISLEKDIRRLSALINETNLDLSAIGEIVTKLLPYKEKLDDESAIFLLKGISLLQNNKEGA